MRIILKGETPILAVIRLHFEFPPFPARVVLSWSPLTSSWVKLSSREFFDPYIYIYAIDNEN